MQQKTEEFRNVIRKDAAEFRKIIQQDVEKNLDSIDNKILPSFNAMKKEASDIASDMTFVFASMPVEETIGNMTGLFEPFWLLLGDVLQVQSQKRLEEVFGRTLDFGPSLDPEAYQENYAAGQQLLLR